MKLSQAKLPFIVSPPPPPHESASCEGGFSTWWGKMCELEAPWQLAMAPFGGGRAGWSEDWYHSITDHQFCAQFNMKMDNGVLLLCYLDKIRLILTGNLWRALSSLYSEARLYKGPRTATRPQSTTLHSTGNISVWTKEVGHSNTRGTVRLCSFPLKLTAAQ